MLDARAARIERQNKEQEERANNPEGLSDRELRRRHAEAMADETALPFDEIRRSLVGM